jgi:hypothetical protein
MEGAPASNAPESDCLVGEVEPESRPPSEPPLDLDPERGPLAEPSADPIVDPPLLVPPESAPLAAPSAPPLELVKPLFAPLPVPEQPSQNTAATTKRRL